MKKRIVCMAMALICLVFSLTSCASGMTMDGSGLTHKKTGIKYTYVLDICYQPIEYADEPYVVWKYNDVKVEYYAIRGLEETEWLYSPMLGELLCSTDEELPDITGFEPNGAFICVEATHPYSIYEIKDRAEVDKIVARYLDPATPSYTTVASVTSYTVKFVSSKYPNFYYSMVLAVDEDAVYIHDRMQGKYIDMGDLFDEYDLYAYYEGES